MATVIADALSIPAPRKKGARGLGRSDLPRAHQIDCVCGVGDLYRDFIVVVVGAWPAMKRFGPGFLVHTGWDPVHLVFGALPFIVGTIIVALGAMILAGGVGLMTAVCITELLPRWLQGPVSYLIELLAFIPSVVYGLVRPAGPGAVASRTVEIWLVLHLGPQFAIFNGAPYGVGYLSAIVILAVMILPLIVSLSREALILVPREQKGSWVRFRRGTWDVVWGISIPYARNGIVGAFVLALGRALGETIAVAMTIGGGFSLPTTVMDQGYTLASVIANEFNEVSSDMYLSALIYCGLILFVITVIVNIARVFHRAENVRNPWLQSLRLLLLPIPRGLRKWRGIVGFGLTAVATLLTLGVLSRFSPTSLSTELARSTWNFFIKEPAAVGEPGGGIAPSLLGTLILVSISMIVGRSARRWRRDLPVRDCGRYAIRPCHAHCDQHVHRRSVHRHGYFRLLHFGQADQYIFRGCRRAGAWHHYDSNHGAHDGRRFAPGPNQHSGGWAWLSGFRNGGSHSGSCCPRRALASLPAEYWRWPALRERPRR